MIARRGYVISIYLNGNLLYLKIIYFNTFKDIRNIYFIKFLLILNVFFYIFYYLVNKSCLIILPFRYLYLESL